MSLYTSLLKPLLFRFEPGWVHDRATASGELLGRFTWTRALVRWFCQYEHPALHTTVDGIQYQNPIGLSGGFDKDVRLTQIMPEVGFGFMEVGSITHHPYAGNPGRHLVRLPKDQAIIVYYGLKNLGATAIRKKVEQLQFKIPTAINIAKTNRADIKGEQSINDYLQTYRLLRDKFAYATINISCPNAQDGCLLQDSPALLNGLLAALQAEPKTIPVYIKISNDLTIPQVDAILEIVKKYPVVDGFIVSNLAKDRTKLKLQSSQITLDLLPAGGISGKPTAANSNRLISHIYRVTQGNYTIIGVGGIFTAQDAYDKIKAGASLVELITGMVYGGPLTIKRIKQGLVKLLEQDGFTNIEQARGVAASK